MNKINYHKLALDEIATFKTKPSLLMHVCCGVCSPYPIKFLMQHFDLTLHFNNSNIYPVQEHDRRLLELKDYLTRANINIKLVEVAYDETYQEFLSPLKDEKEGQKRCVLCFKTRLNQAYKYASENNFDYFTTVMSVSRQKNSALLNQIGEELSHKYPNTKYFYSDFKKDNGNLKSNKIADNFNLYKQDYCGCKYSIRKKVE